MRSLARMQHRILGGTRRIFRAAVAADLRAPLAALVADIATKPPALVQYTHVFFLFFFHLFFYFFF